MSKPDEVVGHNAPIEFQVKTPEQVARARQNPARGMTQDEVQQFLDKPIEGLGSFRGVPDAEQEATE